MAIVEIGAAHRDVIGRRGYAVHLQALIGNLLGIEVVAAGRAAVARRNEDRLALRGGLFPKRAPEGVAALAQFLLALGVAGADDSGLIVLHGTHRSQG